MKKKGTKEKYSCYACGGDMNLEADNVLVCVSCGYSVDLDDYGYEDEYNDYYSSVSDVDDDIPECCEACGGPYPDCMDSCSIFED